MRPTVPAAVALLLALAACGGGGDAPAPVAPPPPPPPPAPPPAPPTDPYGMSAAAAAYIGTALDLMERHSINRQRIAWPAFRAAALERARGATTFAATYDAIRFAVRALGDNHSSFQPPGVVPGLGPGGLPGAARALLAPGAVGQGAEPLPPGAPGGRMLGDGIAYVTVPSMIGSGAALTAFADQVHDVLRRLDAGDPCGWIVDLRRNPGGNMWPMVAGLAPLLGDGVAGVFAYPDSVREWWAVRDGGAGITSDPRVPPATPIVRVTPPVLRLRRASPPVAVLQGGQTASSGEATLLSFRGRAETRTFGGGSTGVSTANRVYPMIDGAALVLTVAVMGDRTGRLYGEVVAPDEAVAGPATPALGVVDSVVAAASRWLRGRPACAGR